MYKKERQDTILGILKENGYVTVDYLTKSLHYSTATINRDLNSLEKQGYILRSYGGAELVKKNEVKLKFRYHKMKIAKRHIGKAAAAHIKPGDVIFIDGSTTTEYMAPYLIAIPDITVITNNMSLTAYLSENGTAVCCLGGKVYEAPYMLGGNETVICAHMHNADKMFFSTIGFSEGGKIFEGGRFQLLHTIMMKNSKKIFYLADHEKSGFEGNIITADFGKVNHIISDYEFPDEIKAKYPDTVFEYVTDNKYSPTKK